jgi:hypothetical protein
MNLLKLLIVLILTGFAKLSAQTCGSCFVTISDTSSAMYTINAGQTFCVDSTGKFTGTLTLNGGNICNKGMFRPHALTLISGSFYNYSSVTINANFTIGSSVLFYGDKRSFVRVNGNFTVSGGAFTNKGIANIHNTASFTAGTFSNSGIFNCQLLSGNTTSITNTGIINSH